MKEYNTILADVPLASNQRDDGKRNPEQHYTTMTAQELKDFKPPASDDCLLLFWAWNNRMTDCLDIIKAWGFTYKTMITWIKPHMGIGNYVRNASEHLLIATKGKSSINPARRHLSWFIAETRRHSRKPEQQYDIAEILGKPPFIELFARRKREGWDSHGNELQGDSMNEYGEELTEIECPVCLHEHHLLKKENRYRCPTCGYAVTDEAQR